MGKTLRKVLEAQKGKKSGLVGWLSLLLPLMPLTLKNK